LGNKDLWERVKVTDPRAVKPITGKQYKGNSPKPYWIVERLTDEFGPCGIGWGFTILNERFERFGESESLHIAVVRLWYVMYIEGVVHRGEFEQVGQTRSSYMSAAGKFIVDEDAPKKSVTDALVKCASYLGFAGDIFSGMWDDSKYVAWAAEEWDRRTTPEPEPQPQPMPQSTLADWLATIAATASIDALAEAKKLGLDAATACKDETAYRAIRAAAAKHAQALAVPA